VQGELELFQRRYKPMLAELRLLLPDAPLKFTNKRLTDLGASVADLLEDAFFLAYRPSGKFLGITALEEASTALGSALAHKGFIEKKYFAAHKHVSKEKIALIGSVAGRFIEEMFKIAMGKISDPRIQITPDGARLTFATDGSGLRAETRITEIQISTQEHNFAQLAERKVKDLLGQGENLDDWLKRRANIRNICLYAGQAGNAKDSFRHQKELVATAQQCIHTLMMAIDVMESSEVPLMLGACLKGLETSADLTSGENA